MGYCKGDYELTLDTLDMTSHDVTGPQASLSDHYRLDSMSIRGGFLTQALYLDEQVDNHVQVSVGFLGVAL